MYQGSVFKNYIRILNFLVYKKFIKNVKIIYYLNRQLLFLPLWISFGLCVLNRFVMFFFTLCVLNGFICYRYYAESSIVAMHCMKVLRNVLDLFINNVYYFTKIYSTL